MSSTKCLVTERYVLYITRECSRLVFYSVFCFVSSREQEHPVKGYKLHRKCEWRKNMWLQRSNGRTQRKRMLNILRTSTKSKQYRLLLHILRKQQQNTKHRDWYMNRINSFCNSDNSHENGRGNLNPRWRKVIKILIERRKKWNSKEQNELKGTSVCKQLSWQGLKTSLDNQLNYDYGIYT